MFVDLFEHERHNYDFYIYRIKTTTITATTMTAAPHLLDLK